MSKKAIKLHFEPTEHEIQCGIVKWADDSKGRWPALDTLYAVPNGGKRHIGTACKLQREGVKPGVPDLVLPVARWVGNHGEPWLSHGLYLEVKRGNVGRVSAEQDEWAFKLTREGNTVRVVRSTGEAIEVIRKYLEGTL